MQTTITQLRSRIVMSLRVAILVLGTSLWAISTVRDVHQSDYISIAINSSIVIITFFILFSRHTSLKAKSYMVICGAYALGMTSMVFNGPLGTTSLWFFTFCSISAALLGRRAAIISIVISLATTVAVLLGQGFLAGGWLTTNEIDGSYYFEWLLDVGFLLSMGVIPAAFLVKSAEQALEDTEVQNREISALNDRLLDTNRALMTMNDTIANSLNMPLRRIRFNVDLMAEECPGNDVRLMKIQEDVEHIGRLAENSQHLSIISQKSLQKEALPLRAMIMQCWKYLQNKDHIVLELDVAQEATVWGDHTLVQRLLDYVFNSLAFYGRQEAPVVCRVRVDDLPREERIIFNTSLDLDQVNTPDTFVPLYSPFFKTDSMVTGTELVIAQHIAHMHGGNMTMSRQPDNGLRVVIGLEKER